MPQDRDPATRMENALAEAAAQVLSDMTTEPVPEPILKLAHALERALWSRREAADSEAAV